jgi:hypothetical protein
MRSDGDDTESSRGLVSARWGLHTGEKKRSATRQWETWGIAFICLLVGMVLGSFFSGSDPRASAHANPEAALKSGGGGHGKGNGKGKGAGVLMAPFGMRTFIV